MKYTEQKSLQYVQEFIKAHDYLKMAGFVGKLSPIIIFKPITKASIIIIALLDLGAVLSKVLLSFIEYYRKSLENQHCTPLTKKSTESSGLTLQHSMSPLVRVGITCFIR